MKSSISTHVESIKKEIEKIQEEERRLLSAFSGFDLVIMPVKPANMMGKVMSSISSYEKSGSDYYMHYSSKRTVEQTCLAAIADANKWKAESDRIHEENLPALENNTALRESIGFLMRRVGIGDVYHTYEFRTKRSRTRESIPHSSGWQSDLQRAVIVNDGYSLVESSYEDFMRRVEEYRKVAAKKEAEEKAKEEQIRKEHLSTRELAQMQVKYKLSAEANWEEVLQVLLETNKHLKIAHSLLQQRNDWSEGFDTARYAIHGFQPDTDEEARAIEDLMKILETVEDGREFRDCKYNYDWFFGKVENKELLDDYNQVVAHIDTM